VPWAATLALGPGQHFSEHPTGAAARGHCHPTSGHPNDGAGRGDEDAHMTAEPQPSQVAALEQTLQAREQAVREQAGRLAVALGEVREYARQLAQSEQALRRQTTILQLVLGSIAEGVLVADEDGMLCHLNRAGEEILGFGLGEVPVERWAERFGCYLPDTVTPYPSERLPLARAVRGETVRDAEVFLRNERRPQGVWLSVTAAPLRDGDGAPRGGVAAFRDVTARKKAEEELRRTAADLARSNEDLQQFAYVVSHDLQEPLRMVSSFCRLLRDRYRGRLDRSADEFIDFAVDGAARMDRLIQDLLAYARVGTHGLRLTQVDSAAVCDRVTADLAAAVVESRASMTRGRLPVVRADESQLGQLLQNLLANAIKFHGPEPPRVHVAAERRADHWLFSVRDNGIGFDPRDRERIFGVFERLHPASEYPGTGIGLAICRRIVERHGGRIWAESGERDGAIFFFTLPDGQGQGAEPAASAG
jgi:PAS domain S-box-containing protein